MRRRSKKLRAKKCATGRVGASRSHFGNDLPPLEPLRKGVSFKKNNDVKYWNAYTTRSVEGAFGTVIIAYVSNTDVDGYPTKYCIVRLDEKMVNIESSGEFQVWGHFPNNLVPFRQLEDNGDTDGAERIYILTIEQVKGIYTIVEAPPTQPKTRGLREHNFKLSDLEIPLLDYLNKNYVLQIILNKNN